MSKLTDILEKANLSAKILDELRLDGNRTIYVLNVKYKQAMDCAERLTLLANETQLVPVFPHEDNVDALSVIARRAASLGTGNLVSSGEKLDLKAWFKSKSEEMPEIGKYGKKKHSLKSVPYSDTLLLVPVKEACQIPSCIPIGGWNDCPPPAVHIAVLKHWFGLYGARLMCLGRDTVFCQVEKPVDSRDSALELAIEQFAYCPDNVLQGFGDGTLSGAAVDLMGSNVWQFWWD